VVDRLAARSPVRTRCGSFPSAHAKDFSNQQPSAGARNGRKERQAAICSEFLKHRNGNNERQKRAADDN
jgi:hypothetical protein